MATRTRAALAADPTGDEEPNSEIAELPAEQSDVDRVASLLQAANGIGRASVRVYKIEAGKLVWCQNYQPAEFEDGDLGMIREHFGAGSFRVMLYGINGNGTFGILGRTELTLAENKKAESGQRLGGYAPPDQFSQVLSQLADNQSKMMQAIVDLKSAPPVDQMAEMTKMLALMSSMRSAMGIDAAPAKSSISEIMSAIREMKKVAEEIAPGEKSEEQTLLGMMPQLLELIKAGVQQQQNAPQATPMLPSNVSRLVIPEALKTPPSAPAAPVQTPSSKPEEDQVKVMEILKMKGLLQQLIQMAVDNKPASEGAQFIYDEIPDDLLEMLDLPNWFDALILFDENVKPHQAWLTEARKGCMQLFADAEGQAERDNEIAKEFDSSRGA